MQLSNAQLWNIDEWAWNSGVPAGNRGHGWASLAHSLGLKVTDGVSALKQVLSDHQLYLRLTLNGRSYLVIADDLTEVK